MGEKAQRQHAKAGEGDSASYSAPYNSGACRFLALDTVLEGGSCAVFQIQARKLQTLSYRKWPQDSSAGPPSKHGRRKQGAKGPRLPRHSGSLPQALKEALRDAGLCGQDMDFFALDIGPGRWTGIRIGMDCIKTMAFILKKPVQPLNSLEITAQHFISSEEPVSLAFNGFKNSVYYGKFLKGLPLAPPCCLPLKKWEEICLQSQRGLFAGDMDRFFKIPPSIRFVSASPDAGAMAQAIFRQRGRLQLIDWRRLSPLYLRSP